MCFWLFVSDESFAEIKLQIKKEIHGRVGNLNLFKAYLLPCLDIKFVQDELQGCFSLSSVLKLKSIF